MKAAPRTAYQGHSHWAVVDRQRARLRTAHVKRDLRAQHKADTERAAEIATIRAERERPIEPGMPDSAIRGLAKQRVEVMAERIVRLDEATTDDAMRAWLCEQVTSLGAEPFQPFHGKTDKAVQLAGMLARSVCPLWWRRRLRRAVVTLREDEGRRCHEVHARGQIYCTDDTLARRMEQNQRNAETLESTEIEDEAGQIITLALAAGAGVANKGIRRKELMTRIRGCEEWAEANGMVGLFTTNTLPSRFHPMAHGAKGAPSRPNPRYDGSKPRDGQAWLCAAWARARAQLHRMGVPFFGFRVAEPHHDMTPHWHMLLWTAPAHLSKLQDTIRAQWLRDEGNEPGAQKHRFAAKEMHSGGAAGYIAKYIAKNIDDAAMPVEGVIDPHATGTNELFGGNVAKRVEAWAAAHRIRQFQAIGQPPVTVWRELRRIEAASVLVAPDAVRRAHDAVNKTEDAQADWCGYLTAQGGAMTGRDYAVRLLTVEVSGQGRYEPVTQNKPCGVYAASEPTRHYRSERREWRPRGGWAAPMTSPPANPHPVYLLQGGGFVPNPAHAQWIAEAPQREAEARAQRGPRTRVNNCTDAPDLMSVGLVGLRPRKTEPGGSNTTEEPPWTSSRPLNPPLTPPSRPSSILSIRSARA